MQALLRSNQTRIMLEPASAEDFMSVMGVTWALLDICIELSRCREIASCCGYSLPLASDTGKSRGFVWALWLL